MFGSVPRDCSTISDRPSPSTSLVPGDAGSGSVVVAGGSVVVAGGSVVVAGGSVVVVALEMVIEVTLDNTVVPSV